MRTELIPVWAGVNHVLQEQLDPLYCSLLPDNTIMHLTYALTMLKLSLCAKKS